ncbi:MAG: hypothetical protein QM647_11620 [Asticcacaulis sp.]|uniref:hypothetical protein n=1 Tax=Asticcacaulis sp. TaxID=1872648 RepID=UPI0039E70A41
MKSAIRLAVLLAGTLSGFAAHAAEPSAHYRQLIVAARHLDDRALREATLDGLSSQTCIQHRARLSPDDKAEIIHTLIASGFVSADPSVPEGVFPAVRDEGSACPRLLQDFTAAPGGNTGSHHDWPGGLVAHEAFNLKVAMALTRLYRQEGGETIDPDTVSAAVLWHDWAKALIFTWKPDGSLPEEVQIAGTGAHHILGLAETLSRGLPPEVVVAQACAHNADQVRVLNWIRAAAIIARTPPEVVARLEAQAKAGPSRACLIDNAADANWVHAEAAVHSADGALREEAAHFGYDPDDQARYRTAYRNPVLRELGADRLQALRQTRGEAGVRRALESLRCKGVM